MANTVAASEGEFPSAAARRNRSLFVSRDRRLTGDRSTGAGQDARRNRMTDTAHALQEPWPDLALQREGVGVGMWVFLMSEILFFAALFCTYAIYRSFNAEAFRIAGRETALIYGATNTLILLTSSLTMTVALRAATAQ